MPHIRNFRRRLRRQGRRIRKLTKESSENDESQAADLSDFNDRLMKLEVDPPTTFKTWCDTIKTDVGIRYPKNDNDIKNILIEANTPPYKKLRCVGATHSAPGLVTDGKNNIGISNPDEQIAMSLFYYQPPLLDPLHGGTWRLGPSTIDPVDKKVRIPAGMTYLDLYQHIRPQCYFLPNQTAGWLFTIGGTVTAPVHGGVFGGDMLNRYVTGLRVIEFHNGSPRIRHITDEEELRHWRCGYGFLGVITAAEFGPLLYRDNFKISHDKELIVWNEANFNALVQNSLDTHIYSEFFIDARSDVPSSDPTGEAMVHQVVFDMKGEGEFVPLSWRCNLNKSLYKTWYKSLQKKFGPESDAPIGLVGDEVISFVNTIIEDLTAVDPEAANSQFTAGANIDLSAFGYGLYAFECATQVNDGFWVKGTPCATIFAFFCPFAYAYEFMNTYRNVFLDRWLETDDLLRNRFNQMAEFRLVDFQAGAPTLFNLPEGRYIVSEVLTLNGYTQSRVNEAFYEMEQQWNNIPYTPGTKPLDPALIKTLPDSSQVIRVFPHVSKNWAYSDDPGHLPFDEKKMSLVQYGCFSEEQRLAFEALRKERDPNDVFLTPHSSWLIQPEAP